MKALSVRQPWAWLIVHGHKDVENRTWSTKFRGLFLIHAAWKLDREGYDRVRTEMGVVLPEIGDLERGGLVGSAELVDCVREHDSPWFGGPYGFVLRNPRPGPFRPLPGRLGFFEVDD